MATNGYSTAGNIVTSTGTGAAIGASVGGPWGAVIGGGVGLLGGIFTSLAQADSEEEKRKIIEKAAKDYGVSVDEMKTAVANWYEQNNPIGSAKDVETYKQLIADYDPNEFVYDFSEFDNNYDVNDYYAPNRQAIIDKTSDQLQHTAAGAGIGRGTGAANQIATGVANKNEELYRDALQAMNQDRQFAYNIWNANIQNQQQRLNQLKSAYDTRLNLYGGLAQDYQNWNKDKFQTELDLARDEANNKMALTLSSI